MIHKFFTNNVPSRYTVDNLLAVFDSTELPASTYHPDRWFVVNDHDDYYHLTSSSYRYDLSWYCNISNTQFAKNIDADGYPCVRRESSNSNPWSLSRTSNTPPNTQYLSSLMLNNQFTVQMTCTFEEFVNYRGLFGLHQAGNYDGIIGGQYEDGYVKFGVYSKNSDGRATAYTVSVPKASMPSQYTRFNWALTINGTSIKLYFNGILYNSITKPTNVSFSTSLGCTLGYAYVGANRFTKSNFYSILLYNKELSSNEVYTNFFVDKRKYGL